MIRKRAKEVWYDRLHKGGVLACMAMTVYAGGYIATFLYNYYVNVKPQRMAEYRLSQHELLDEGSSEKILVKDKVADLA